MILTGSDLVAPAFKWDLDYLTAHIGSGPFAVFCHTKHSTSECSNTECSNTEAACSCPQNNRNEQGSNNHSTHDVPGVGESCNEGKIVKKAKKRTPINIFKYYDEKKVHALQDKSVFQPDISRVEMSFGEFLLRYNGDRYLYYLVLY